MALRKEPRRRYGSAAQLAQDLERHLQNRPVTARPDSVRYRTRKFARRHRVGLAATAVIVLLVAGFVASLIAQGRQLARERDKARYALSFLVDTFKQADPYETKGEKLTAREILDQGADRVARELAGQPDVQAAVMDAIGEVDRGLGRLDKAEPLLDRALELRRSVFGSDSLEVAESLERLADLENDRADREGAESHLREALAIRRRRPERGDAAMARNLNRLGEVLVSKGVASEEVPRIEALHREALEIAREAEGPEGLTVAETLLALANLQRSQGSYPEAERLFREGLEIERQALGDQAPRLWRDRSELAVLLFEAGKLKESEALNRRCLRAQRRLLGPAHPDSIATLNNLAMAIQHQGRYAEAVTLHRESLALTRALYGPTHWQVGVVLGNLGAAVDASGGETMEAIHYYEEALEIRRRALGEGDPLVAQNLLLLAELYRNDKRLSKALDLARQALGILEKAEGPDHPHVAFALREIGRNYDQQGRFLEAEPYLRRSLEIRLAKLEPQHPDVAKAQVSLARILIHLGRYDEAEGLLHKAQVTFVAVYGPGHAMAQMPLRDLAEIARRRAAKGSAAEAAARPRRSPG
jgi:serine/threonine-protein kinase